MREIRVHGQKSRYYHTRVGVNGRLDTLQCAILIPKLERFPWELEQRTKRAQRYNEALSGLEKQGVKIPRLVGDNTSSWAQYTLCVPAREKLQKYLQDNGVPTAVHYPMTMADQPAYKENGRILNIEVSRRLADQVLSLPIYPDMTDDIQDVVIHHLQKFYS
jgi:UDP-2-acetamido-2-deoxy-ribo-hexuluronate aminotransferase